MYFVVYVTVIHILTNKLGKLRHVESQYCNKKLLLLQVSAQRCPQQAVELVLIRLEPVVDQNDYIVL